MPARPGDRLAVRTLREHGEEVAYSDPLTSDAERAAAGRETVAQRFRALLPANRERAAARPVRGNPRPARSRHLAPQAPGIVVPAAVTTIPPMPWVPTMATRSGFAPARRIPGRDSGQDAHRENPDNSGFAVRI